MTGSFAGLPEKFTSQCRRMWCSIFLSGRADANRDGGRGLYPDTPVWWISSSIVTDLLLECSGHTRNDWRKKSSHIHACFELKTRRKVGARTSHSRLNFILCVGSLCDLQPFGLFSGRLPLVIVWRALCLLPRNPPAGLECGNPLCSHLSAECVGCFVVGSKP